MYFAMSHFYNQRVFVHYRTHRPILHNQSISGSSDSMYLLHCAFNTANI